MARAIDFLSAPVLVCWQLTRDCNLACVHCCTDSAPGKRLADELTKDEALALADEIIERQVPYVMLCGGEPLVVPHFFDIAERLGRAGVHLKVETNGQLFDDAVAERLARLPIRSVQVSLDADTLETYRRQRPTASLEKVHAACRAVRAAGLPLEVTFAPTRQTIDEAGAVVDRAIELGAFRFNTGKLMRVGTAARLWDKIAPTRDQEARFLRALRAKQRVLLDSGMEFCYIPYSLAAGLRRSILSPPSVLLVLPNGLIKMAAALPFICADVRRHSLAEAWDRYRDAWADEALVAAAGLAAADDRLHAEANLWRALPERPRLDQLEII